jgi:hypothetical protein
MNENAPITLTLTPAALRVIVTVLRKSDPLQIYAAALVAEIEKQASEQPPKESETP